MQKHPVIIRGADKLHGEHARIEQVSSYLTKSKEGRYLEKKWFKNTGGKKGAEKKPEIRMLDNQKEK